MKPVLEITDFSVAYRSPSGEKDVRAVDQVSLSLYPGEVVGLAGESGSGKSTLAYGSCRLLRPPAVITGGSVRYNGQRSGFSSMDVLQLDGEGLRQLRWREIAIVFQSAMNALNPVLSIRAQLTDAIHAHMDMSRSDADDKAASLLDLVGIPRSRLRGFPHQLSGGMRQRVMIAMALASDPEVIIMDEPTTALDVVVQRDILAQIAELRERLGFAILFITHDLSLLLELADRIAVMYAGRLLETGTSRELHYEPAHPYTRGLLNSFPSLHGPRRELAGIPGSPPDPRNLPPGCPFLPRCGYGTSACEEVDMSLLPVTGSDDPEHRTACPFVGPDTPAPEVVETEARSLWSRRRPRRLAARSRWRRPASARTSRSAAVRSCTRSATSRSACTRAPWWRWSERAGLASQPSPGYSRGRNARPRAASSSTAPR
jgi:oligopeptide/dipeptide ABC transporter ATP-binding protein